MGNFQTHQIYALTVDGLIFYIGYCRRDLQQRLKEHIYQALNPTDTHLINEAIRGGEDAKRTIIKTATEEGWELSIVSVYKCPTHEPLDEDWWIQHYRNNGHKLTNIAPGSVFQPHCLVNGKQVATSNNGVAIKDVELRRTRQRQLRMTPKQWQEFIDRHWVGYKKLQKYADDLDIFRSREEVEQHFLPLYIPI